MLAFIELRWPDWGIDERMEFVEFIAELDARYLKVVADLMPSTKDKQ